MHLFGIQWTFAFNFNFAVHSIFIDVFNQQQLQLSDISQQAILLELNSFKFYCIAPIDPQILAYTLVYILTYLHTHMHTHVLTPISLTKFHLWWYMPFAALRCLCAALSLACVCVATPTHKQARASVCVCVNPIWLTLRVSATDSNCNQFTFVHFASELKTSLEIFLFCQPRLPFYFAFSFSACVFVCVCQSVCVSFFFNFIIWHSLHSSRLFVVVVFGLAVFSCSCS